MSSPYFDQIAQNIQALLSDKKFKEAYKLCIDFLRKFPEERVFLKLKEKIEESVLEENINIVDQKIEEAKPLWDKENYADILKMLQPLLKLTPNYKKLQKEILKAQELYQEQIKEIQEKFLKNQRLRLEKVFKENPEWIVQEFINLERNTSENPQVKNLILEYKTKYIQKKIQEKNELLNSDKFDAIYNLIDQLKKIDAENEILKKLEDKIKNRQHGSQIEETKEFVYSGESHLETLMKIKKFDKAIKVAEEILETDKNNKQVAKILKEAKAKFYAQSRDQVGELIEQNQKILDNEYQQNKDNFTKL